MRPANVVTAITDILAGYAIAFHKFPVFDDNIWPLIMATIGLYGGGVVLNDAFDAKLDAIERPERPIPSGKVSVSKAMLLGFSLLLFGCSAAWFSNSMSGLIASFITVLVIVYDTYGKRHSFVGPLNMGLCRGGNLLLGMSANPETLTSWSYLAIISIVYIAAVTMVSRGEVYGGNSKPLYAAFFLYLFVVLAQMFVAYISAQQFFVSVMLLFVFAAFIFAPLVKAIKYPFAPNIRKAVKTGILSLMLMDAAWCISFGNMPLALICILLIPVSFLFSKFFAVT
jgi:hypothetical protein